MNRSQGVSLVLLDPEEVVQLHHSDRGGNLGRRATQDQRLAMSCCQSVRRGHKQSDSRGINDSDLAHVYQNARKTPAFRRGDISVF